MNLRFTKMQGTGNDFMVVDAVRQHAVFGADLIRKLADRHFGVGFDQLLVVEKPSMPDVDFHYRIFNADGSEVQMCGNGARCFARFVLEQGLTTKRKIRVSTVSGVLELKVNADDTVTVNMGRPVFEPDKIPFRAEREQKVYTIPLEGFGSVECGVVSMGNPHAVLRPERLDDQTVQKLGPALQASELFPEGVNVGFMKVLGRDEIDLRVFERGCGETLACGSGACAAVVVGVEQGLLGNRVRINLRGGTITAEYGGSGSDVTITGPAQSVFEGSMEIDG